MELDLPISGALSRGESGFLFDGHDTVWTKGVRLAHAVTSSRWERNWLSQTAIWQSRLAVPLPALVRLDRFNLASTDSSERVDVLIGAGNVNKLNIRRSHKAMRRRLAIWLRKQERKFYSKDSNDEYARNSRFIDGDIFVSKSAAMLCACIADGKLSIFDSLYKGRYSEGGRRLRCSKRTPNSLTGTHGKNVANYLGVNRFNVS